MRPYQFTTYRIDTQCGRDIRPLQQFIKYCVQNSISFHYEPSMREFQILYWYSEEQERDIQRFARRLKVNKITDLETAASTFKI